ncbi:hypothetical protein J7E70_22335 [Variovorax paradoxus]|nr:hypothetical protein [Variovorax paradoxus]MBT2303192.1 hypothetical protein [Variovorax paradoxus]
MITAPHARPPAATPPPGAPPTWSATPRWTLRFDAAARPALFRLSFEHNQETI